MKKYDELVEKAIETINKDDDLFIQLVDELDSYMGFADGFRCFQMDELDDFYCDCKVSKLLNDITDDFNLNDDYFYFSIYGVESTDSVIDLYRDHTDAGEIFDNLLNYHYNIYYYDSDFEELMESIVNFNSEDE